MFDGCAEILLKKAGPVSKGSEYSLYSEQNRIGTIEEGTISSRSIKRFLRMLLPLPVIELELILFDVHANTLGVIRKERGFQKALFLFSPEEEHIATLRPEGKLKAPAVTVTDQYGNRLMRAYGNYGATDFSVMDSSMERQISYLKKRPYETAAMDKNIENRRGYYNIENHQQECLITFALITICVVLDLYFHN